MARPTPSSPACGPPCGSGWASSRGCARRARVPVPLGRRLARSPAGDKARRRRPRPGDPRARRTGARVSGARRRTPAVKHAAGAPARRRVPAAERREELISAAVHEFARGGLHGTAVERIARRVGVAQPYVFSLFSNKRELFLAALERSFERVARHLRTGGAGIPRRARVAGQRGRPRRRWAAPTPRCC